MSALPKILFVDDDPTLVSSLRTVLHRDRTRWDLSFALGGVEALALLNTTTFDLVCTDMRMPVVDGTALLRAIATRSPATIRVILSGSDCDSAAGHYHELLVKPCSVTTLRTTLQRLLGR